MTDAPPGRLVRQPRRRPAPWAAVLAATMAACGTAEAPPTDTAAGPGAPWPGETWPVSTPEAEGFDGQAIDALVADLEGGAYGLVDAFLLIRNGRAVAD